MAPNEEKYRLRIPFKEKFPEICWFCSEKIPDHLMRNFGQREQLKPLPFEREWILRRWKLACWKGWPKMTPVVFQPCCHHNLLDKQRIHPLILGKLTLPVKTVKLKTFRIEVAPKSAARARNGVTEELVDEEDSPAESDDGKKPSLITATRICSRRELSRCIRRDRKKIQIALAAMTLSILLFLLSIVWFLENKAPTPDVRYRTDDIPQNAWLAAGWGLPPVVREQRTVKPLHPTGFH